MRRILQIVILTVALAAVLLAVTPQAVRAECNLYHTVQPGQNLYRISLRYGVNMYTIAAANNIANVNRIYVGQSLYIPCSGGTYYGVVTTPVWPGYPTYPTPYPGYPTYGTPFPGYPTYGTPYPGYPTTGGVDCTGFRATSPDGFPNGSTIFYWDAPKSGKVDMFQVLVLNDKSQFVGAFSTTGLATRVNGDVSVNSIGKGVKFTWYVVALVGNQEVCRTQQVSLQREWTGDLTSG